MNIHHSLLFLLLGRLLLFAVLVVAVALLLGELVDIAVGGVESVVRPADESQVLLLEVLVQTLVEVAAMVALKEGRRRLILAEIKV